MKKPVPKQTQTNPNANYVLTSKAFDKINGREKKTVEKVVNPPRPAPSYKSRLNAFSDLSNMYSTMRSKSGPCRACGHR